MDKIKKLIFVLIILIIIIIIILLNILRGSTEDYDGNSDQNISNEESFDESDLKLNNSEFSIVTNNSEYYAIKKIIDDFYEYSNIVYNENYLSQEGASYIDEELSDEDKQVYKKFILDMLADKYKEEFSVNESNLQNYVSNLLKNNYIIDSMYKSARANNIIIYLVYGQLGYTGDNYDFMVAVDLTSNAYEIYLNDYIKKYNYVEESIANLEIENDNIELNDNNKYVSKDYTAQEMAQEYLSNYKEILENDLEKAYDLLDNEYKEAKFEDYNEFQEYYNLRRAQIQGSTLQKYKISNKGSYTQYMCIDNYDNYYIFNAEGVMKYTVQLDEYTILPDEYIQAYEAATDEQKVQTNIDTFFKMINTKDYKAAYNVLDDTFKQNNFATLDEFKEYAQNNFFDNTTITNVIDLSKTGTYYACTIATASDTSDSAQTGEETFIVALGNGTDFTLSFTVK